MIHLVIVSCSCFPPLLPFLHLLFSIESLAFFFGTAVKRLETPHSSLSLHTHTSTHHDQNVFSYHYKTFEVMFVTEMLHMNVVFYLLLIQMYDVESQM